MKKIITEIGDKKINEELDKFERYKILNKDIQYEEGIIEVLEEKQEVDILIISDTVLNYEKTINFINNIKLINEKIKIILILKNINDKIENFLEINSIKFILEKDKINNEELLKKIINLIEEKNININYNYLGGVLWKIKRR